MGDAGAGTPQVPPPRLVRRVEGKLATVRWRGRMMIYQGDFPMVRCFPPQWILTTLTLVLLAGPATAQTQEPFRGSGTLTVTRIHVGDCFDSVRCKAQGKSTPLGPFQGVGHQYVDYCGLPDIVGELMLTAANGDQLSIYYVGSRLEDPTTFLCRVLDTQGTGQYQGAMVDAGLLIENYNLANSFEFTFAGTIQYP
jgi:hypothetical protein